MKMLTKFESKSSRAKGVAFHPRRPWLLVSLHSSTIQLWDYRMGTLIDRFEDHDGPVRCVAFHPTQPIFVSGGDDYTIKVWSTQTRKCMFTFTGHLDYVRTVFFHEELPWIISASDDQTIRIWNWQNRKEIACLTGHNHYVMCAQFHPKQDLIVSASLDQTVRVWDISGLVKKHSMPTSSNPMNNPNSMMRDEPLQQDIFGNTDAIVKYVLEGHDKGVNWASFHPKLPLIISGGDDRSVKLWRMSDTRAWEVDGCRGHTNNVPCVLFHPTEDLIISVGEDKTIRSWDLNTRSPIKQFKRENDRFWMIVAHPHINLFAACHDSGVMVFKLDRERPASTQMSTNELLFINNANQIQEYNFNSKTASLPSLSLKKIAQPWNKIKNISYNNFEKSLLIQSGDNDNGIYSFFNLSKELIGATDPNVKGKGKANSAYFIARNRFVTFLQSQHKLDVHDLNDNITKSITLDNEVKDILPSHPGTILLLKPASVTLYDVQQKKELSTVQMNNAKYCVWSNDHQYLALLSKHTIIIVNKNFEIVMSMHETIRIKSAAFDDSGVLFYSTLNHIKYVLLNGDKGTIKTLENTMYIVKVQGKNCFCLNRKGEVECLEIDPTEYRFKKALINKKFNEVLRIIKGSNLVGENIIAYLEKSGYPEVALQFVQDPEVRFDLAIECHDLSTALVEAKKINSKNIWEKLGKEALSQGNMNIVELVYQQLHLLDKLSFLYLTTGETSKLDKMARIAESRDDISSLFTNSVYLGDVERKIQTFLSSGLTPLAYATAKSNGLEDIADKILENAGISADEISLPKGFGDSNKTCDVLQPVNKLDNQWPLSEAKLSFFEQALSGNMENLSIEDREETHEHVAGSQDFNDNEAYVDEDEDELFEGGDDDAWDLGDEDLDVELQEENEMEEMDVGDTSKLSKELKLWIKNAKTAGAYIAAGKFDIAMNMLNKQACVKNFEPFKERFMEIYTSSKLNVLTFDEGANEGKTALINDTEKMLNNGINVGLVPGFEQLESLVQEGYKLFKANQLESSIDVFRRIIYIIATLSLTNEDEEEKCLEILNICKEYILGLRIELTRRALPATEVKRNLELASYFTCVGLQPAHRLNALQVAMTQSFKAKNFNHASYFANEFLKISSTGTRAEQARKIQAKSDSISTDSISIDFDPFSEFEICAGDFVPLYGSEIVREKLLGVSYGSKWKGKICEVTLVSEIGGIGSGLRLIN